MWSIPVELFQAYLLCQLEGIFPISFKVPTFHNEQTSHFIKRQSTLSESSLNFKKAFNSLDF